MYCPPVNPYQVASSALQNACYYVAMHKVRHIVTREVTEIPAAHSVVLRNTPMVLSAPHGGPYVLEKYADNFTFGDGIRVDNDMYTAEVYPLHLGSSIAAHLCPHQVNMNRAWDAEPRLDPIHMLSYLPEDPIYKNAPTPAMREELGAYYHAYHDALKELVLRMRDTYGYALLMECHSLNSRALANTPDAGSTDRADFVIGTLDDTSADPRVLDLFHESLEQEATPRGLRVVRNDPYKGGHTTKLWAKPQEGIHVIQLEMKKKLYMCEGIDPDDGTNAFTKRTTFGDIQHVLARAYAQTRDGVHTLLAK